MTNLKKLGLSALAGSLVAISAQAGEMSVSGAINATYKTKSGGVTTGAGSIGNDKDVAFTGSGELDNGWTFKMVSTMVDAGTISSNYTTITMGSLGTINVNGLHAGGAGGKYDEEVPQAYEQTSDGMSNSSNTVGSTLDSSSLTYNSPSYDLGGGATASFDVDYAPHAQDLATNDGGLTAMNVDKGAGYGLGATLKYDALTIGAYGAEIESRTSAVTTKTDAFEGVWYAKYAYGPMVVGYSESYVDAGVLPAQTAITVAKVVGTAGGIFASTSVSIAYNLNDNLSMSYTNTEDTYDAQNGSGTTGASADTADVDQDTSAYQIAYSMGAMSVKAYMMNTSNPGYDSDADDQTVTEIALGLAF